MPWLPIVFVIIIVLLMIIVGYFLIRSFLREYTYDLPSKTQSKRAPFSGIYVTLLAVSILAFPVIR
jgi:putative Mn2+ efflux pump MntP